MPNLTTSRSEHASPLAGVTDRATAQAAARGVLSSELSSGHTAYFALAGVRILSALLLAAHRAHLPLSTVSAWADDSQHPGNTVVGTIERFLTGPDADPKDVLTFRECQATCLRLDGAVAESSAVWGVLESALGLYLPRQPLDV